MVTRTVIIPNVDNNGRSLANEQAAFETRLLDIAGGFTDEQVHGAWRDEAGKVYRDASHKYTVCLTPAQDAQLVACLPDVCAACRQECIFTASHDEDVQFVTASVPAATHAA